MDTCTLSLIWFIFLRGRGSAIGRVPLRHNALQPHAADVPKHGWAVFRQMLNELDDFLLGPAEQLASRFQRPS